MLNCVKKKKVYKEILYRIERDTDVRLNNSYCVNFQKEPCVILDLPALPKCTSGSGFHFKLLTNLLVTVATYLYNIKLLLIIYNEIRQGGKSLASPM